MFYSRPFSWKLFCPFKPGKTKRLCCIGLIIGFIWVLASAMKFDSHSIFGPIGLELVLRKPKVWKDWNESSLNFVCAKVENCYSP